MKQDNIIQDSIYNANIVQYLTLSGTTADGVLGIRTLDRRMVGGILLKLGNPRPLLCLFSSFQTNITIFTTYIGM